MKRIRKKLRCKRGLTLVELLITLVLLSLMSLAIGAGTTAAMNIYIESVRHSEAAVLSSTLMQALTDELRFAQNIQPDSTYNSAAYGDGVKIEAKDGKLIVVSSMTDSSGATTSVNNPLIGSGAYTNGLSAQVTIAYTDGVFEITLDIQKPNGVNASGDPITASVLKQVLSVRAVNS